MGLKCSQTVLTVEKAPVLRLLVQIQPGGLFLLAASLGILSHQKWVHPS